MKLVLVSDFHLLSKRPIGRVDQILSTQWDKLRFILETAQNLSKIVIQAGDLFDKPRDWSVLDKFISIKNEYPDVKFYSIYGQHDLYFREFNAVCNMSILEKLNIIKILSRKRKLLYRFQIVGCSFGETKIPYFDERLETLFVVHAPITNSNINIEHSSAELFLKKHPKFKYILCGDIHIPFLLQNKKQIIMNTGCIVRHTRDEINKTYKPFFYILDTDKGNVSIKNIPCLDYADAFLSRKEESSITLNQFLDDLIEKQTQSTNVLSNIMQFLATDKTTSIEAKAVIHKLLNDQSIEVTE